MIVNFHSKKVYTEKMTMCGSYRNIVEKAESRRCIFSAVMPGGSNGHESAMDGGNIRRGPR